MWIALMLLGGTCAVATAEEEKPPLDAAVVATLPREQFAEALTDFVYLPPAEADRWPLLERCAAEDTAATLDAVERLSYSCQALARSLAMETGEDDRLWATHDRLPAASRLRASLTEGVLSRRLRSVAADTALLAPPPSPMSPVPTVPETAAEEETAEEPPAVRAAPEDLRAAWRARRDVMERWGRTQSAWSKASPRSYMKERGAFEEAIEGYLRGSVSAQDTIVEIGRFEWGSWCGTGADVFASPRDAVMELALLEAGAYDIARDVVVSGLSYPSQLEEDNLPWIGLARRLGIDGEAVMASALLEGITPAAKPLTYTEAGARRLLSVLDLPSPYEKARIGDRTSVMLAVASLVEPSADCNPGMDSLDDPRAGVTMPDDVQQAALAALAVRATAEHGMDDMLFVGRELQRLCRVESVPALWQMTRSRFDGVRRLGRESLRARGIAVREPAPVPPVQLRLRVDGAPWSGDLQRLLLVGTSTLLDTVEVANGRLALDRDLFLDEEEPVTSLLLEPSHPDVVPPLWFLVATPPERLLGAARTIDVHTTRAEFRMEPQAAGQCVGEACTLTIEAEQPAGAAFVPHAGFKPIADPQAVTAGSAWTLRLERGRRYRARLDALGYSWTSEPFALAAEPVMVALRGDQLVARRQEVF